MPDLAIHAVNVHKQFGSFRALDGLNLSVPNGAIYALLGSNGAGKTTLGRILLGLTSLTSGALTVFGHAAGHGPLPRAARVAGCVEAPTFYPHLSGEQNLRVFGLTSGLQGRALEDSIARLLCSVGLQERRTHPVKHYSLGMRQRLGLAAVLLTDPSLVILDESFNGLDPEGTKFLRRMLAALQAEGRTVLLSSHLMDEVERVCTDLAVIRQGKALWQGSLAALHAEFPDHTLEAVYDALMQPCPQTSLSLASS